MITGFRILGPVEVDGAGGPVVIRGARRRALLVRLLIEGGRPVTADRLAEDVWDGAPPPGAASTLTSHVSLLRRQLGPDRLVGGAGSYRLMLAPGELDAQAFGDDLARGRASVDQGDPRRAVELLTRALGRWTGPALADVQGAAWAEAETVRLEELRMEAEELLLDCRLALGEHRAVVAQAEAAASAHPLREQRWATLMLALYRSGRQADALRAYQRLRLHLDDELGLVPSPGLEALEESIILHRPDLDWTEVAVLPRSGAELPAPVAPGTVALVAAHRPGPDGGGAPAGSPAGPVDGLVRDALVQHGGRVVEAPAGEVVAVFTGPSSALAAAMAMQQSAHADPPGPGRAGVGPGGLCIGVAVGEVGDGTSDHRADAVAQARALCRAASTGEVLVGAPVRSLIGRRSRLTFTDRGPVTVGAGPDPVPVLALEWKPLERGRVDIPLPEGLRTEHREYVGRAGEQATLSGAFDRAVAGERQVVLLGGEPGIGKTALTAVVARSVEAAGGVVLYGRCPEMAAPYQPFVDALTHYVRFAPRHELEAHVEAFGGELVRLVPALAQRVPDVPPPSTSDPDTERYLAFAAASGLLVEAARHRPVLLVLDDLHWADEATLHLLRQTVTATPATPLLVLGTFRSSEVTPDHPLADALAALWREQGVDRIELAGLSAAEVMDLCVAAAGRPVDDDDSEGFVAGLQRDTGGNPFFVWELLRHLVESGALVRDGDDRWSAGQVWLSSGLPASLREVIAQRVHHLGEHADQVLSLAAVIGVEFELAVLARASGGDDERLVELLEDAERSMLVAEVGDGGTFAFAHALTRHTLYDALGASRRRRLHTRVAAALEEGVIGPAPPALLAYHFAEGGAPGPALHYAELAGHDALAAMAPDEAARWFCEARQLLEAVQPGEQLRRCDLTTQLGMAQLLAGDPAHRQTLLEAVALAEEAGDPRRMAVAALANTRGYYSAAGQIDAERTAALRSALERLGGADGRLSALLRARLCSETVFDTPLAERRAQAEAAVAQARTQDDPATLLAVLNLVFEARRHPSLLAQRLEDTGTALDLAEQLGDPGAQFWAVNSRMQTLLEAGAVDEAAVMADRSGAIAEEVGQPVMRWMTVFGRAQWALLRGETAEGEALAEEALALGQALGQPDAFNYYATQLTHARWQQGRLGELVELIEVGAAENPGIPAYAGALARALCQAGRHDEAARLLYASDAAGFALLPEDLLWAYGLSTFAEAAIQLENQAAAASLYGHLAPYDRLLVFVGTSCEGPIAHYLGGLATVLGRFDEARRHLDLALRLGRAAGSPFFVARTRLEQGRLAARQGNAPRAARRLADARARAEAGGFLGEVRRAEQALATLG